MRNDWAFLKPMSELPGEVFETESGSRFHFIDNDADILIVAHCDSVQGQNFVRTDRHKVYSPSLDNRIGVWLALSELPKRGVKADILLTDDEERGMSTASLFAASTANRKQYKWIAQFDRMGYDAACYQYMEPALSEKLRKHGYTPVNGSYTCICTMEALGVKAVNFGVGYNNYHSMNSYIWLNELYTLIDMFLGFYNEFKDEAMPHTMRPAVKFTSYGTGTSVRNFRSYDDDDWYGESYSGRGGNGGTGRKPWTGGTKDIATTPQTYNEWWEKTGETREEEEEDSATDPNAGAEVEYITDDAAFGICEGCDDAFHASDLFFDQMTETIMCDSCMMLLYGTSAYTRLDLLDTPDPVMCIDCMAASVTVKDRIVQGQKMPLCAVCADNYGVLAEEDDADDTGLDPDEIPLPRLLTTAGVQ